MLVVRKFFSRLVEKIRPLFLFKKNKFFWLAASLLFIAAVFLPFQGAFAQLSIEGVTTGIFNGFAHLISYIFVGLANLFVMLTIFLLRLFIWIASYNGYIEAPAVVLGWVMVRDLANMFFIVALLAIAFGTILGLEQYEWKKAMVKLVIAAVLINFSKLIAGVIIDAAHVFTITFANAIMAVAGGNLINMLNLDAIGALSANQSVIDSGTDIMDKMRVDLLVGAFAVLMFSIIAMVSVFAYTVVMAARMVILWVLIILSPIAYIASVLPVTKKYADEYWQEFTKYIIVAPMLTFFLWLAFATFGSGDTVLNHINETAPSALLTFDTPGGESTAGLTIMQFTTWDNLASFFIAVVFLFVGLEQVNKMGVKGGSMVSAAMDFGKKAAMIASGYLVGRAIYEGGKGLAKKGAGMGWHMVGGRRLGNLKNKVVAGFYQARKGQNDVAKSFNDQALGYKEKAKQATGWLERAKFNVAALLSNGAASAIETGGRKDERSKKLAQVAENFKKIYELNFQTSDSDEAKAALSSANLLKKEEAKSAGKKDEKTAKDELSKQLAGDVIAGERKLQEGFTDDLKRALEEIEEKKSQELKEDGEGGRKEREEALEKTLNAKFLEYKNIDKEIKYKEDRNTFEYQGDPDGAAKALKEDPEYQELLVKKAKNQPQILEEIAELEQRKELNRPENIEAKYAKLAEEATKKYQAAPGEKEREIAELKEKWQQLNTKEITMPDGSKVQVVPDFKITEDDVAFEKVRQIVDKSVASGGAIKDDLGLRTEKQKLTAQRDYLQKKGNTPGALAMQNRIDNLETNFYEENLKLQTLTSNERAAAMGTFATQIKKVTEDLKNMDAATRNSAQGIKLTAQLNDLTRKSMVLDGFIQNKGTAYESDEAKRYALEAIGWKEPQTQQNALRRWYSIKLGRVVKEDEMKQYDSATGKLKIEGELRKNIGDETVYRSLMRSQVLGVKNQLTQGNFDIGTLNIREVHDKKTGSLGYDMDVMDSKLQNQIRVLETKMSKAVGTTKADIEAKINKLVEKSLQDSIKSGVKRAEEYYNSHLVDIKKANQIPAVRSASGKIEEFSQEQLDFIGRGFSGVNSHFISSGNFDNIFGSLEVDLDYNNPEKTHQQVSSFIKVLEKNLTDSHALEAAKKKMQGIFDKMKLKDSNSSIESIFNIAIENVRSKEKAANSGRGSNKTQ